jgi:hypothetical protein
MGPALWNLHVSVQMHHDGCAVFNGRRYDPYTLCTTIQFSSGVPSNACTLTACPSIDGLARGFSFTVTQVSAVKRLVLAYWLDENCASTLAGE